MLTSDNIARIEERILNACLRAGRKREEITLMGVTKFESAEKVEDAYRCGIRCFGESRVKEACEKFEGLREILCNAEVHLIGSLQRNKAKQAAGFFDCIQSADRYELIDELKKHSHLRKSALNILLELHTGEQTKSGFADIDALFKAAEITLASQSGAAVNNLRLCGLMTMAPFTDDKDVIRSSFRQLVKAKCELEKRFPAQEGKVSWSILSMGMSNDFEIAVEEGSTMLRIGSAIFKEQ